MARFSLSRVFVICFALVNLGLWIGVPLTPLANTSALGGMVNNSFSILSICFTSPLVECTKYHQFSTSSVLAALSGYEPDAFTVSLMEGTYFAGLGLATLSVFVAVVVASLPGAESSAQQLRTKLDFVLSSIAAFGLCAQGFAAVPIAYLAHGVEGDIVMSLDVGVILASASLPFAFATFVAAVTVGMRDVPGGAGSGGAAGRSKLAVNSQRICNNQTNASEISMYSPADVDLLQPAHFSVAASEPSSRRGGRHPNNNNSSSNNNNADERARDVLASGMELPVSEQERV